jgi:hypothetical protein
VTVDCVSSDSLYRLVRVESSLHRREHQPWSPSSNLRGLTMNRRVLRRCGRPIAYLCTLALVCSTTRLRRVIVEVHLCDPPTPRLSPKSSQVSLGEIGRRGSSTSLWSHADASSWRDWVTLNLRWHKSPPPNWLLGSSELGVKVRRVNSFPRGLVERIGGVVVAK